MRIMDAIRQAEQNVSVDDQRPIMERVKDGIMNSDLAMIVVRTLGIGLITFSWMYFIWMLLK